MDEIDALAIMASDNLINYCSTCLKKSSLLHELRPNGSYLVEKFLNSIHLEKQNNFHVCNLCKLAIDFISQFEQLCDTSKAVVDNYEVIDIRSEYIQEEFTNDKVTEALETLRNWVDLILVENLEMYKLEDTEYQNVEANCPENEFNDDNLTSEIKTEQLIEEYLIDANFDQRIDVTDVKKEVIDESESKDLNEKPRKRFQLYNCEINGCRSKFVNQRGLNIHIEKIHGLDIFKREKIYEESFVCTEDDCKFAATSQHKLNRHLEMVHELVVRKSFCCDVCGKIYPTKSRLSYHLNIHYNRTPFACDFEGCTRKFRNPTRLRNHKQEFHLQIIRMHCAVCGKGFRTKASHDLHILGHEKPTIPCEVCGKLLTNRKTLATHLKIHTGERRYQCSVPGCDKAFTKCSGLQVHMRSHTKEKPYKCPQCQVSFSYKVSLKKHMLKTHDVPWETSSHIKPEPQKFKIEIVQPE
uniref:CSON000366 protein n=1 Tax=Culicoides sonorensis TaxID=179676 RepID=A0A336KXZ9_CULSO